MNRTCTLILLLLAETTCMNGAEPRAETAEPVLFVAGNHGYAFYRSLTLALSPKGTVLALSEGRVNGRHKDEDVMDVVLRRSVDGGTVYSQGTLTRDNYGRDHHPRCYSIWMAGAGIKGGHVHGETDDFSYNIVKDPVHIHDLNATALHLLGMDHTRLTYRFQGRDYRLTDVHGKVVRDILA